MNQYHKNLVVKTLEVFVKERDLARNDESLMFHILSMEAYSFLEELE